jgi:uncharacterized protein (TIGR02246 family)
MTETLRQSQDALGDELEIRNLVHRYADASSRRDAGGVASTLAANGEWESPAMGNYRGRDAVAYFFTTMLEDWSAFIQAVLSGVVVLDTDDPDRAKGRWFVQETGQQSGGTNLSVAGVYHDRYVREDGAWRIGYRRYDPLLISADGAVTALPFPADVPAIE